MSWRAVGPSTPIFIGDVIGGRADRFVTIFQEDAKEAAPFLHGVLWLYRPAHEGFRGEFVPFSRRAAARGLADLGLGWLDDFLARTDPGAEPLRALPVHRRGVGAA